MLIWNGLGFLVAVIAFACFLAAEYLTESAFKDDQYYQHHLWPKCFALLVAGAVLWFLGSYLYARPARYLIDPETNEKVVFRKSHSFFFIPMHFWGGFFVILSAVLMIYNRFNR